MNENDSWKLATPPEDEFLGPEPDEEELPCSCCGGTGTVNPLTAPPGFFCAGVEDCPLCDGAGNVL
jgi:DnaJ-class molecular chaperone